MKRIGIVFWLVFFSLASFFPQQITHAQTGQPQVIVLTLDGELTQPMVDYLSRGINQAEQQGAELVVVQLNTPGGAIVLMTDIVTVIRASTVPVVVYVSPSGAMAGSAGTIITLAGHAAAMAPETSIGAASPVGSAGEDLGTTLATKEKEILKATVRSLMTRRPADAVTLAENMIDNAQAVSASEALNVGLIDFIASDVNDLLRQLNGFQVVVNDQTISLNTTNPQVTYVTNTFLEQLLAALSNSNIVYLLLVIGMQAILIEISSPGGWVAGFIGVICLAFATYGLGILPVNWIGLIFIIASFVLFILDIKAPTHGALTVAGIGSFIAGSLILFNSANVPNIQPVSVPLVVATGIITGVVFFAIVSIGIRAQRTPLRMERGSLVGRTGLARTDLNPNGTVQVGGELWSASISDKEHPIPQDSPIEVVQVNGMHLTVRPRQP